MSILKTLSYLGGYFNSTEFELDNVKVADIAEISEDELSAELEELHNKGDIELVNKTIKLINIKPVKNEIFNTTYEPVETINWNKHTMLKLDV